MDSASQGDKKQETGWGQGISQINEAIQHNVTASRLMWAGAFALGAGITAYLWDSKRRADMMDMWGRWPEDVKKAFGASAPGDISSGD